MCVLYVWYIDLRKNLVFFIEMNVKHLEHFVSSHHQLPTSYLVQQECQVEDEGILLSE